MIFGPVTVYIFMFINQDPASILFGQQLNKFLRIIPSYNVSKTLLFCGTKSILFRKMNTDGLDFPPEIELERWTYENQLGDLAWMGIHFVAGTIMIFFFEGVIYQTVWFRWYYRVFKKFYSPTDTKEEDDKKIDADVKYEARRVA